jgi:hypothetical protein
MHGESGGRLRVPTPDDIQGGLTDAGKLKLTDEGLTLDVEGEVHYTEGPSPSGDPGFFYMRDSIGIFNPRDFNPGGPPGTAVYGRFAVPVQPLSTSNNTYDEIGTLFYKFASLGSANVRLWDGFYDSSTSMQIRIVRRSDGAVIAETPVVSGTGAVQLDLTTNLPTADDVLSLQAVRRSGGGNAQQTIVAGFFSFEP